MRKNFGGFKGRWICSFKITRLLSEFNSAIECIFFIKVKTDKNAKINSITTGTSMMGGGVRKNDVRIWIKKYIMNSIAILTRSGTVPEWRVDFEITKEKGIDIKIQQRSHIYWDVDHTLSIGEVHWGKSQRGEIQRV